MPRKPKQENDDLAKAIGGRISEAMERIAVNITELHKRTGISRTVLLAYTRGDYAPGARELKLLCEALDTTPTIVLFGAEALSKTPYRLGSIPISTRGAKTVVFLSLLGKLTAKEQDSLLTLAESIVQARDPKDHGEAIAAMVALLESDVGRQITAQMEAAIDNFMTPEIVQSLEAEAKTRGTTVPGTKAR